MSTFYDECGYPVPRPTHTERLGECAAAAFARHYELEADLLAHVIRDVWAGMDEASRCGVTAALFSDDLLAIWDVLHAMYERARAVSPAFLADRIKLLRTVRAKLRKAGWWGTGEPPMPRTGFWDNRDGFSVLRCRWSDAQLVEMACAFEGADVRESVRQAAADLLRCHANVRAAWRASARLEDALCAAASRLPAEVARERRRKKVAA